MMEQKCTVEEYDLYLKQANHVVVVLDVVVVELDVVVNTVIVVVVVVTVVVVVVFGA